MIVIVLVLVGAAGYFYMNANKTMAPSDQSSTYQSPTTMMQSSAPMMDILEQTVQLAQQNASGESGTADLIEKDGKVTVILKVTGGAAGVPQPAHIHAGKCPDVGAVEYPLTNVVDGKSETVLDVTMAQLAAKQPMGINVHKSVPLIKNYVACGDLNIPMGAPSSSATTSTTTTKTTTTPAASPAATSQSMMKY